MKRVVFVVLIHKISNQQMYEQYIQLVVEIINAHHGEYLARSNRMTPFCGKQPQRSIIIGFDTMEQALKCFSSKAYSAIKPLRENSTTSTAFFLENP